MKNKSLFQIIILTLLIFAQVFVAFPALAKPIAAHAQATQTVINYQTPCKSGIRAGVTTWHDSGSLSRYAYDWVCEGSREVYPPHNGVVQYTHYYSSPDITHGMVMIYDSENNVCITMAHLDSSFAVSVGNSVTTDTKIGTYTTSEGHTHMAVNPGQCSSYSHAKEQPIMFNEIGKVLSQKITIDGTMAGSDGARVWVTDSAGANTEPRIPFSSNANAKLFFDQGDQRANLQVCADNIAGKSLFVKFWREGRWFTPRSEVAQGNCHTFWDLDEAGAVLKDRPYRAWVSIGNWPDTNWQAGCFASSGQEGLCPQAQFPGESIDPSTPPVTQDKIFGNGVSTPTIDVDTVNLKVCGDNINGQVVYWQMWRDDRVWDGQETASDRCITFTNMDGDGPVLSGVTYYTVASLNPIGTDQAKQQRTACAGTTGGKQLCDAISYTAQNTCATPGKSVDAAFFTDTINNLNTQTEHNISNNEFAVKALQIWQRYEGTNACLNPLATTWGRPSATNFNSVGVKNYATREDGIAATANTLGTKNIGNYQAIRQMLGLKSFDEGGLAANLKTYSGGGGYITNLMNEWRALYNQYAVGPTPVTPTPVTPTPITLTPVTPTPATPTPITLAAASAQFDPTTAEIGKTVTANFYYDPQGQPVKGLEFACTFNQTALKYIKVTEAGAFGSDPVFAPLEGENGKRIWSIAGSNGQMMSNGGLVFSATFETLSAADVSLNCAVRRLTQSDEMQDVTFTPATLKITAAPITITPTVTPTSTPTETPTVTPTPAATTLTVSAQVILSNQAYGVATLRILDAGGKEIASLSPDAEGKFSAQVQSGQYTFTISAPGFLSATRTDTISANASLPTVTLLAGDIDQNGIIDPLDVGTLGNMYGKSPLTLAAADLTGDQLVDLRDLVLLAANYRKTGPTAWK